MYLVRFPKLGLLAKFGLFCTLCNNRKHFYFLRIQTNLYILFFGDKHLTNFGYLMFLGRTKILFSITQLQSGTIYDWKWIL